MSEPIRILLADDTLIAREGWKKILETAEDMQVVGDVCAIEELGYQAGALNPQVVLLDLKWGHDQEAGLRSIRTLKRTLPATRVISVSAYTESLARARANGADGILSKSFSRQELLAVIRGVTGDPPAPMMAADTPLRGEELWAGRLKSIAPGAGGARDYEKLMEKLLPFLFEGHLSDWAFQSRHLAGEQIWDGVAFNNSSHVFWSTVRQLYGAAQILLEFKNVGAVTKDHILQVSSYLKDPGINLGIVVTRETPSTGALREMHSNYLLRGEVILCLGDDEILEMLRVRVDGGEPTDLLRRIYLDLIRQ